MTLGLMPAMEKKLLVIPTDCSSSPVENNAEHVFYDSWRKKHANVAGIAVTAGVA